MSISWLSTASMIIVLDYMLEGEPRQLLASNDLLTPMLSRLEKARERLVASRGEVKSPLSPEEERRLRQELGTLDQEHDRLQRHLHGLLQMAEDNATTSNYKDTIASLRKDLYPFGLNIVRMKWVEEAGEASRLGEQIASDSVKQLLEPITFGTPELQTTGFALAEQIVTTGQKMSEALVRLFSVDTNGGLTLETQAKRQFTALLTRLVSLAELEWRDQPQQIEKVFKALQEQLAQNAPSGTATDKGSDSPKEPEPDTPSDAKEAPATPAPETD